jgi:hypothetical protein
MWLAASAMDSAYFNSGWRPANDLIPGLDRDIGALREDLTALHRCNHVCVRGSAPDTDGEAISHEAFKHFAPR